MRIYEQPQVHMIGLTMASGDGVYHFLDNNKTTWDTDATSDMSAIVEFAGRVCYMSFGDAQGHTTNEGYVENLLKRGHGSVLEHASLTFAIEGISRGLSHEWVRHRAGCSYSQLSQRYVSPEHIAFVVPPTVAEYPELRPTWLRQMEAALDAYTAYAQEIDKVLPVTLGKRQLRKRMYETARGMLPNDAETKLVFTANLRALRHILLLRGQPDAHPEFRRAVAALLLEAQPQAGPLLADLAITMGDDGLPVITAIYRGV